MSVIRPQRLWRSSAVLVALVAGVGAPGCYEGFDPLDPEVIAEVARGRGDAQGFEHSGIYGGTFEALECGCDSLDDRFNVSLCPLIDMLTDLGFEDALALELIQADGSVRAQALPGSDFLELGDNSLSLPLLYGSLQAEGRISAAGVIAVDVLVAEGQVLARIDGTLEGETQAWRLQVEYQQRYVLDVIASDELGAEFTKESDPTVVSADCRERIALDLIWLAPPLGPLGGG